MQQLIQKKNTSGTAGLFHQKGSMFIILLSKKHWATWYLFEDGETTAYPEYHSCLSNFFYSRWLSSCCRECSMDWWTLQLPSSMKVVVYNVVRMLLMLLDSLIIDGDIHFSLFLKILKENFRSSFCDLRLTPYSVTQQDIDAKHNSKCSFGWLKRNKIKVLVKVLDLNVIQMQWPDQKWAAHALKLSDVAALSQEKWIRHPTTAISKTELCLLEAFRCSCCCWR